MSIRHAACCLALVAITAGIATAQQESTAARVSAGDYTIELTRDGLLIAHKGQPISIGSYFTVSNPEYKGHLISTRHAWREDRVSVSEDKRAVVLEAKLPNGELTYSAAVSEKGVRVTARVAVAEGAVVGPVEYAIFQIPPEVVAGGVVEVWNAAGMTIQRKDIPSVPKRGGMTGSGLGLTIKTPARNIVVSSLSYASIYPFDARVESYGKKQGLWPFCGPSVVAGKETVVITELSIQPPDPPPVEGTIRFASGAAATAVATAADAPDREKAAADELVEYLARISGKRLDQVEIADGVMPEGVLAVGSLAKDAGLVSQAELDAMQRDGYVVKVFGNRAAICGWRDAGTIYGAYALLKHLGAKFYAPSCEVVPKAKDLVIPDCQLSAKPIYEFRKVTQNLKLGHTPGDDIMNPREIGQPGSIVHAAAYLLPFDMYHEEHPEYFALQKDGKRLHREEGKRFDVHLCLSNPDVRRICAERLLDLIEVQKDRTFFGVSQGDGHWWCQCDECKAFDALAGMDMTDRLLDYVNYIAREVAKKHPDKRILTLAYTNATSPPPTKVLPEPNVMVQYCPYPRRTSCHCHDLTCEKNTQALEDLTGWIAKCPDNMYIFDYPCGYQNWYEPFGSFYAMKHKLDFYAANGIRGIYYCGTPRNFQDLFIFVQSRLHWEPDADVEALIDEFMAAYYGAAAPHIREYFDFMHREIDERPVHQMCEAANPGLVTPEYADKALAMFDKAEAAVAEDRASLYRVRAEKLCVLFADINERNPINLQLAVDEDTFARRLAEFLDIGRTMRIGQMVRRKPMSDWLYQVARIRADARRWYTDPLVGRLIADPVKTLAEEQQLYSQKKIEGGWLLELDGFLGCKGPSDYGHECPTKRAVWIYGKNTKNPVMFTRLGLEDAPAGAARLVLVAQDDDKPGAVPISVAVNGQEIFSGPNPFKQRGWSEAEFPIPAGLLKPGENEFRFATLNESTASDQGWFMIAECKVLAE